MVGIAPILIRRTARLDLVRPIQIPKAFSSYFYLRPYEIPYPRQQP
jgi:hypothetical protein